MRENLEDYLIPNTNIAVGLKKMIKKSWKEQHKRNQLCTCGHAQHRHNYFELSPSCRIDSCTCSGFEIANNLQYLMMLNTLDNIIGD